MFIVFAFCMCRARGRGRPRLSVDIEDIEFLRGLRFSYTKIAAILGVSRATLYRKLEEEGVNPSSLYAEISDTDLDQEIVDIKRHQPNDGERLVIGHLATRGIIVPRARVRGSIHRVDPENTAVRRSVTIRRRVYHVDGPNSLWHVDGHHKLIRWRMVTHGGIDGYSRTVVFLSCSDNNRASTMFSTFVTAVQRHGLPERIRTDLGGENVDIWCYVAEQHGSTSAVITGSSTHNQRIERLWRDVYRCVGVLYHDCFRKLEEEECLDPLNEVDMYCLHYVFMPRVNRTLQSFVDSWNNHSLSTEHNLTPNQLFIRGAIQQRMVPQCSSSSSRGPFTAPLSSVSNHVGVPRIAFFPCTLMYQDINRINPLSSSTDFGCDLYKRVVTIVGQHLRSGCSTCSLWLSQTFLYCNVNLWTIVKQ